MVEASSDWKETTTLLRAVTWIASEATVNIRVRDGGAMDASDSPGFRLVWQGRY